ncbi:MAG: YdcF family protein [Alphaproteobacteria bacterium]|nr:YdcF family protein [Alphaproteobacteria bacterium]
MLGVALHRLLISGAAAFALWLAGLVWFATPPQVETKPVTTDAIVVLTGGSQRLQSGIELLLEGKGRMLFVSGVNQEVELNELLRVSGNPPEWVACCIALGHAADNTVGNARETAQWMGQQGFRSLRLVTAWYHMPRSLLEFDRAMPETEIIAHPVFPDQVRQQHWTTWHGAAALLISEYNKYLGALVRPVLERVQFESAAALAKAETAP